MQMYTDAYMSDAYMWMHVLCIQVHVLEGEEWWRGTAAGKYAVRRLQIKRCGELARWALLALDCCPNFCTGWIKENYCWVMKLHKYYNILGVNS